MNEVRYLLFKLGDVFTVRRGERQTNASRVPGGIPYYSATQNNNGVTDFISNPTFTESNKIVVSTFCHAYWAPNEFTASDEMTLLHNSRLNEPIALYICRLISNNRHMYGFNRKAFSYRLKDQKIMLPVNSNNQPDWNYMEQYIETWKVESVEETIQFLKVELAKIGDSKEVALNNANWQIYIIDDIIDISNGVRLTSGDMNEGVRPFIGATEYNNGITNYVSNTNKSQDSNVLGINYNGSVCEGFYHPYEAVFSDDVKRLKFKEGINNEYTLHFLLTVVEKQRKKYQYGYKFNTTRMKNQKIMLPATLSGEPDYEFMENYIKGMKYDSIMKAINFIENKNKDAN